MPSSWHPLPALIHARVVQPFLPLDVEDTAESTPGTRRKVVKSFRNLYPGDQVYLFETTDGTAKAEFGRGYVIFQPVPSDFSSTITDLSRLPENRIAVSVVPLACLLILDSAESISEPSKSAAATLSSLSAASMDLSGSQEESALGNLIVDDGGDLESVVSGVSDASKPARPAVSLIDAIKNADNAEAAKQDDSDEGSNRAILSEITLQMKNLSTIMFALYAKNDFDFFNKLVEIFDELDDLRVNLTHDLLTRFEAGIARKNVILLFNKIAKLLASSGGKINHGDRKKSAKVSDASGNGSIFARDEHTAGLFSLANEETGSTGANPAVIAENQVLGALSPNYPLLTHVISFVPQRNHKFDALPASNILIDFKEVAGSSTVTPKGYDGMTAFMYLRNSKRRLTQAFSISINPDQEVFLDNLSAALFTNIPASEVESGKIYLVAILTEQIRLPQDTSGTNSAVAGSLDKNQENNLKSIRKGICAGVADISRVFSRKKGHLASGEAHRFVIKLFSSYLVSSKQQQQQPQDLSQLYPGMNQKIAMSIAMANSGWGELVDRIISGSDKGVAVNPRAETLILSIKELKAEDKALVQSSDSDVGSVTSDESATALEGSLDDATAAAASFVPLQRVATAGSFSSGSGEMSALASIGTIAFNPLSPPTEMVYLRVARFGDLGIKFGDHTFLTVVLRATSSRIRFAGGANEATHSSWQFLSLSPTETLNEVVQISGLARPAEQGAGGKDYLFFDVYANGSLLGRGQYLLRSDGRVFDTGLFLKKAQRVDIIGSGSTGLGALEFDLEYVGTRYNVDPAADAILRWRPQTEQPPLPPTPGAAGTDPASLLTRFRRCEVPTLTKFLPGLLFQVIRIFDYAIVTNQPTLKSAAFDSMVHMLDVTIARHVDHVVLFDQFMARYKGLLPRVGEILLSRMTAHFSAFDSAWNSTGRALCRVSVLILRIANACIHHRTEFVTQGYRFVNAITAFLSSTKEKLAADQLLVLQSLELFLDVLRHTFQMSELATFAVAWANATGLRGLASFEEPESNALANRRKTREHQILISKLLFVRRLLAGFIIAKGSQTSRELLVVNALKLVFRVLNSSTIDLDCARLSLGVMLAVLTAAYGKDRLFTDRSVALDLTLVRCIPALCHIFNRYHEYCQNNGYLKPKRAYTQLFPNSYPFTEYTMDSIVSDESFAEVLLEFSVLAAFIAEVSWDTRDSVRKYIAAPESFDGPLANYASLNEFLGPPGIGIGSPEALRQFVHSLQSQVVVLHYPGTRWSSLKALMVHAVERCMDLVSPVMEEAAAAANFTILASPNAPLMGSPSALNSPGSVNGTTLKAEFMSATSSTSAISAPISGASADDQAAGGGGGGADGFDSEIWCSYLTILVHVAAAMPASLEHLASIPRKGCFKLAGDVRTRSANLAGRLWDALGVAAAPEDVQRFQIERFGGRQRDIVAAGGVPFLEELFLFCMQRNARCRDVGGAMCWSIIAGEMAVSDSLFTLEEHCVTALYNIFEKRGNKYVCEATEIKAFVTTLRKAASKMDDEDVAAATVMQFTDTIASYLDTLAGLQSIPDGAEFDDDRTFYKLKISGYLLDVDRPELFQSFVADMYDANLAKQNFTQAALSLQLLADTYEWDTSAFVPASENPALPRQTMFKRKAELYQVIAKQFGRGNRLEQSVAVHKDLLAAYEKYNYDLAGLSACHTELAKLYTAMQTVDSLDSTFFKISFIGYGFPESIRGKQFIYEGLPYEHITSINHRLIRLYPGSRIINNDDEAAKMLADTPFGRFLHMKTVQQKKMSPAALAAAAAAAVTADGQASAAANTIGTAAASAAASAIAAVARAAANTAAAQAKTTTSLFVATRRLPGSSSITTLWTEEATYETLMTFPTLMNRSEIRSTTVVKLSPVKNAIHSLLKQNDELTNLELLIQQNLRDNVSLPSIASSAMFGNLSRVLAGTVDSPVNGGMGQYRVFFDKSQLSSMAQANEEGLAEYETDASELHSCFNSLVSLLSRLLKLHGLIVPDSLREQHEAMVELFGENFKVEIASLNLDLSTPLDYDSLMKSLTAVSGHNRRRHQNAKAIFGNAPAGQNGGAGVSVGRRRHRKPDRHRRDSQSFAGGSTLSFDGSSGSASTPRDSRSASVMFGDGGSTSSPSLLKSTTKRTVMDFM